MLVWLLWAERSGERFPYRPWHRHCRWNWAPSAGLIILWPNEYASPLYSRSRIVWSSIPRDLQTSTTPMIFAVWGKYCSISCIASQGKCCCVISYCFISVLNRAASSKQTSLFLAYRIKYRGWMKGLSVMTGLRLGVFFFAASKMTPALSFSFGFL